MHFHVAILYNRQSCGLAILRDFNIINVLFTGAELRIAEGNPFHVRERRFCQSHLCSRRKLLRPLNKLTVCRDLLVILVVEIFVARFNLYVHCELGAFRHELTALYNVLLKRVAVAIYALNGTRTGLSELNCLLKAIAVHVCCVAERGPVRDATFPFVVGVVVDLPVFLRAPTAGGLWNRDRCGLSVLTQIHLSVQRIDILRHTATVETVQRET